MKIDEAKQILRNRYESRGYKVRQIRKSGDQLNVCFGQKANGKGAGPGGLESVLCNWPTTDAGVQVELKFTPKKRKKKVKRSLLRK